MAGQGELTLDPATTALIVVDVQNFTMGHTTFPHTAQQILERNVTLAERCRARGVTVVLVRIIGDPARRLATVTDAPFASFSFPDDWREFPPVLGPKEGDVVVVKHNWGSFYGTDLDLVLRRKGIRTVLITGIATNFGVESTARQAHEAAYAVINVEDAMGDYTPEDHRFATERIFPRLGRVRTTAQVLSALG